MNLKMWMKKYYKEISIGIIVSFITTGIVKSVDWFVNIAPAAGNSLWKFLSNTFFICVAQTSETSWLEALYGLFFGIVIGCIGEIIRRTLKISNQSIKDCNELINRIKQNEYNPVETKPETSCKETVKEKAVAVVKKAQKYKKYAIALIATIVLFIALWTGFNLLPYGLWTKYQRDLIKITPYIEQHELDIIKSKWVCMQNKEDYDDIYRQINTIKEENDLP